ncbi:MAG: DNA polymerase III subunit delta [Gammaproteobacteria bacterium]|nr:DNA polymerase III subunit delta [Gammaproteobacteria bacterium]
MKLGPERLAEQLRRGPLPVYLLTGDEPLLRGEAADMVRAELRARGFAERQVLHVESGFDWSRLTGAAASLSLFAERRLIELRMEGAKPGEAGARALEAYAAAPPADTVLLILCAKLDAPAQRSRWHQAIERAGAVVTVRPVRVEQLPGWIHARMRARGFEPTDEAVQLLAERAEGNLLACAQEVEKLALLQPPGPVDAAALARAVGDSARFSVYDLGDAVLAGDIARVVRIVQGLRAEGIEPTLALWAVTREVRLLGSLAGERARGAGLGALMARYRIWERRKPWVQRALRRHEPERWAALLGECARVDRVIKGVAPGRAWEELLQLALEAAGCELHPGRAGAL